MGKRYYRRVRFGKHIFLNLSKGGHSWSFKIGGMTINPKRNRVTYNNPLVKGLSTTYKLSDLKKPKSKMTREEKLELSKQKLEVAREKRRMAQQKNRDKINEIKTNKTTRKIMIANISLIIFILLCLML